MGDSAVTGWPVDLAGVTETVVTSKGPEGTWNAAALGVIGGETPTAETWGRTRTRHNFEARGTGYVQFTDDPELFTEAALGIVERDDPILSESGAWVEVSVETCDRRYEGETEVLTWSLAAEESAVCEETVPRFRRGAAAVVEATVAASRLEVPSHDRPVLVDRLEHLAAIVDRCGGPAERRAMGRVATLSSWEPGPSVPLVGADGNESF